MKKKFFKGDLVVFFENGEQTNSNTNLDQDRELAVGDIFEWRLFERMPTVKMKVVSTDYPLAVEEVY